MRQAGMLANEAYAQRFVDYLLTQGISAKIESTDGGQLIWVRDENEVARSKQELETFLSQPDDPRYAAAVKSAAELRRETAERARRASGNVVELRNRWHGGMGVAGRTVTMTFIVISVAVSIATNFGKDPGKLTSKLWLSDVRVIPQLSNLVNPSGGSLPEIRRGEVWRLVTPIFMHADLMHLLFNMYWLYLLGGLIESRRGPWRMLALVLFTAVVSNLGEYFGTGNAWFGGMSGVVYGLFGYAWMKTRYEPGSGILLRPNTIVLMLVWLVLCMTGLVGPIANWAHGVGLVAGMLVGIAPRLGIG